MARLIGPGRGEVTIFRFRSTGVPALIVEAADFIKEEWQAGGEPEFLVWGITANGWEIKFRIK